MRVLRTGLALCGLFSVTLGCTDAARRSSTTAPAPPSSAAPVMTGSPGIDAARTSMERYFAAVSAGDFDGSMAERCIVDRIPPDQEVLFLAQARDLLDMGAMTGVQVADEPGLHIMPSTASAHPIPFDFAILSGPTRSEWMHGVAIVEDGDVRLCGWGETHIDRITTELATGVTSGRAYAGRLEDLMPGDGPPGEQHFEDRSLDRIDDQPVGWQSAWQRGWIRNSYGGTRVTATRFDSAQAASSAVAAAVDRATGDVTETFSIEGVHNAVGMRYAAAAWTWLQPPDVGYQCDQVFMLYGDTMVRVASCGLTSDESHQGVIDLASTIDATT